MGTNSASIARYLRSDSAFTHISFAELEQFAAIPDFVALQAPVIAAAGVVTNLLATGAAFGVAKWIFQDGGLHSLLGFQPQGFLDAWGPVFSSR